jgi:pimeloyl-ACP methyl ester carboxylesterase
MPLPHTRFVDAGGLRLAYREWPGSPSATPILCLPHLTGHKGSFAPLARRLAPARRVLALDLRGRGESDQPAEGYGFAYHARDILAFADALGLPQFILLGHSFGATAAVYLAALRPRRVRALVLLDGGADPPDETLLSMVPTVRRLDQVYPSLEAYLAAQRALPFYQPWSAALEDYFRDEALAGAADGSVRSRSSGAAIERDLHQHFFYKVSLLHPALRCPVLWLRPANGLAGARGHVFIEAQAQAIVAAIPHCTRVDVPGANHYTMLLADDPPVTAPIREFLGTMDYGQ